MELIQKKVLVFQALLYNQETGGWCLFFPFKAQGLAALQIRAVLIVNLTAFAQNRVTLFLPTLSPSICFCFSSLLINVLCGILSPPNPQEQGTFVTIKNLFRQLSFLFIDFLNGIQKLSYCLLVSRSCFCYLDIFENKTLSTIIKPSFTRIKFSSFRFFFALSCYIMTLLFLKSYQSPQVCLSYNNPAPTLKLHFQYSVKRYFAKNAGFSHLLT